MKAETYFLMAILIAMAAAMAVIMNFSFWQAKLAPMTVTGIMVILGAFQLKREISTARSADPAAAPGEGKAQPNLRIYLIEGAWMAGFVAAVYLFGLLAAILFFGIAYMKTHGASLPMSILVTALIVLFSYAVFSYILDVRFYPGLISDTFLG
ncbi:MAG: tripartite tricarboxylate transporter TctB family protein [Desulfobacterales bacterium]|nr:tripartite tricarboxylate transporter TctB family protein [Desulfobacterales bacterium]